MKRSEWKKAQRGRKFIKRRRMFLRFGTSILLVGVIFGVIVVFQIKKTPSATVSEIPETVAAVSTAEPPKEVLVQMNAIEPVVLLAEHTIMHPSSPNRDENLAVCARIINGKTNGYILMPGKKFSYIKVIGNPDIKRGFKEAGEIRDGEPVDGVGGGVCQVMSTINSAVHKTRLKTDVKHLHAEKHSLPSTYLNPAKGDKEASVAFSSGKDFWFINTLDYPIRIKVKAKNGNVTVKIFSVPTQKEISN